MLCGSNYGLQCDDGLSAQAHVCELDWMKPEQAAQWSAPFDFVFAADCIYHEVRRLTCPVLSLMHA